MHRILIALVFCAPLSAGAQTDAERARQLFDEVKQLCADAPEYCFIVEGEPTECPDPNVQVEALKGEVADGLSDIQAVLERYPQ